MAKEAINSLTAINLAAFSELHRMLSAPGPHLLAYDHQTELLQHWIRMITNDLVGAATTQEVAEAYFLRTAFGKAGPEWQVEFPQDGSGSKEMLLSYRSGDTRTVALMLVQAFPAAGRIHVSYKSAEGDPGLPLTENGSTHNGKWTAIELNRDKDGHTAYTIDSRLVHR